MWLLFVSPAQKLTHKTFFNSPIPAHLVYHHHRLCRHTNYHRSSGSFSCWGCYFSLWKPKIVSHFAIEMCRVVDRKAPGCQSVKYAHIINKRTQHNYIIHTISKPAVLFLIIHSVMPNDGKQQVNKRLLCSVRIQFWVVNRQHTVQSIVCSRQTKNFNFGNGNEMGEKSFSVQCS